MHTIITLAEKLHKYNPKLVLNNKNLINLTGAKLFCGDQTSFEPNIIYCGKLSDISQLKITKSEVNFFCIQDTLLPIKSSKIGCNSNILIARNYSDFASTFNMLQDIFNADKRVSGNTEILLDALVYNKGIQHMIEISSKVLNNPVVLLDADNQLVAKSQLIETDDAIWNELLVNGCFSQETLDYIMRAKIRELSLAHRYPYIYHDVNKIQHQRIIGNVRINGSVVAFLIVLELNKKINEDDLELCSYLCDIMSTELQKNRMYLNFKRASYDTFLSDVLNHEIETPDVINQRAKNIGLKLKKNLFFMAVTYRIHEKMNFEVLDVRDTAERLLSGSKAFIHNDSVLVLITKEHSDFLPHEYFKPFLEYLTSKNLIAGLSNCFHHLHELPLHYEHSQKAIDLGHYLNHPGVLFKYKIYQIYHLLEICSGQVDLTNFCNPIIQEIIDYDKNNSTELTKTIYTYLHFSKDTIRTAKSLHVHRNTVFYRIEKIKALFKLDFNDGRLTQSIFLSLYMMEICRKIMLPDIIIDS